MWFSEWCIQRQVWYQGGWTWRDAGYRAATVKAQRDAECAHEKAPKPPDLPEVLPARSAAHRVKLEGEMERRSMDREKDRKEGKEKKRRRRHRRVSPSPDPHLERRSRRKPPSDSDGDEEDRKATGRDKKVWIQVPRSSLKAY